MSESLEFKLNGAEYIELKNLLKVTGLCGSGGAAKAVIDEGQVSVDGLKEIRKSFKVMAGQSVVFDGHSIKVLA